VTVTRPLGEKHDSRCFLR